MSSLCRLTRLYSGLHSFSESWPLLASSASSPVLLLAVLWSLRPSCLSDVPSSCLHFEFAVSFVCNTDSPWARAFRAECRAGRAASPACYPSLYSSDLLQCSCGRPFRQTTGELRDHRAPFRVAPTASSTWNAACSVVALVAGCARV